MRHIYENSLNMSFAQCERLKNIEETTSQSSDRSVSSCGGGAGVTLHFVSVFKLKQAVKLLCK